MIIEDKNMKGAYSAILTREVYIIAEKNFGGDDTLAEFDAPSLQLIGQEEFTPELARETLDYI